ncbi:MAG: DUF2027 domain-containing protein [Bacteroidales bacterium]|nr:DUF2027 domain-containing protein [Bacteroidales bacterium]
MVKFKAGDQVKFLNDVGGGTIVRIMDSRLALVAIDDGFEVPVLMSELIPVEQSRNKSDRETAQQALQQSLREKEEHEAKERDKARKSGLRRFAKNPETEGFYLAFVPHEQQWLLTGLMDVVLINHSPLNIQYSLILKTDNQFVTADYGQMMPYSKIVIETISREDIQQWTQGVVQAVLIAEQGSVFYLPLHAVFNIRPNRFYKEGSYVASAVLGEKAIMVMLDGLLSLKTDSLMMQKDFAIPVSEPVRQPLKEKPLIEKHAKSPGEAIVDLHIGELVNNIAGLSSHDMFKIQMDYFHKTLNSAIKEEYDKITYIHGVGNGVLKNGIIKALENFEGLNNRMASMSKFGVGAIEILIKDK